MANQKKSDNMQLVTLEVPEALKKIDLKINEMKHIQDSVYTTNGQITMGTGGKKDIKSETSVDELVKAYASVKARAEYLEQAYTDLDFKRYPVVKVDGFELKDWKRDILLRISIIEQKDTLDELKSLKKEWEELMDKEDRKKILMEKMSKIS